MTKTYDLPGAQIYNCTLEHVLLCEGSIIRASLIRNSVIGVRSVIGEGCLIEDSILLGNEYYERPPLVSGEPGRIVSIGRNTRIKKAIIDENVQIGHNVSLENRAGHQNYTSPDGKLFVRDGIIVVPRNASLPNHYSF